MLKRLEIWLAIGLSALYIYLSINVWKKQGFDVTGEAINFTVTAALWFVLVVCIVRTRKGANLFIHRAIYGSDFGGQDVTALVRSLVQDNRLSIKVGSDIFGDPCPNQFKHLTVEYSHGGGGKRFTKIVQQEHWCTLT